MLSAVGYEVHRRSGELAQDGAHVASVWINAYMAVSKKRRRIISIRHARKKHERLNGMTDAKQSKHNRTKRERNEEEKETEI